MNTDKRFAPTKIIRRQVACSSRPPNTNKQNVEMEQTFEAFESIKEQAHRQPRDFIPKQAEAAAARGWNLKINEEPPTYRVWLRGETAPAELWLLS